MFQQIIFVRFQLIMASLHQHRIDDGSDRECKKSCSLEYGISEVFTRNVIEHQKSKPSKLRNQPQIFDDPKDQENNNHMMGDELLTTFNDESDKEIFRKALEGMEKNYPEIFNGTEKNMFYCPTAYNFDSRIKAIKAAKSASNI